MLSFPAAHPGRTTARGFLRRITFIYVAYAALMFAGQRRLIFPRQFAHVHPNALAGLDGVQHLFLPIEGGQVEALFLPAKPLVPGGRTPAVIFAHGNGELIDDWGWPLDRYRELGISVLIPEFRGYGRSSGSPSQEAIVSDFVRFYDQLASRPEIDPNRIYFHGRSIGGGVVCALAAQRKPAALILQSTFATMGALANRRLLPAFLLRDPFDSLSVIRTLDVPIYIAHGKRDFLIPYSQGETLARAAQHREFHALECTHADCPPNWDLFMSDVGRFLASNR